MKKILLSTAMLLFVGSAVALGTTGAFFSDTETSSGNTFTAGSIDLKIDNHSYYNGNACADVDESLEVENWQWTGNGAYPVPGTPCTTSWELDELNDKAITLHKFFDFLDLKPGDYSEDTISIHVDTNDSYLCANVTLTSNDDNGINEPEAGDGDLTDGVGGGELGDNVNFIWWADDGDNVLETNENVISQGPIGDIGVGNSYPIVLADSDQNIWTGVGGPVPGNETLYIGKAWCFGTITPSALPADDDVLNNPGQDNNGNQIAGEPADGGYSCNGTALNNVTQSDSLTADISFSAVQARNNPGFQCEAPRDPRGTLIVRKVLVNDDGGQLLDEDDFSFTVNAGSSIPFESDGENQIEVPVGIYDIGEDFETGYSTEYNNCSDVVVLDGQTEICTITNNDDPPAPQPAKLIVNKIVTNNDGGNNVEADFQMTVDGSNVLQGAENSFTAGSHTVSESGVSGYVASFSGDCDVNGDVVLVAGQTKTCTVTNNDLPANITLIKNVTNNNGGLATAASFTLRIDGGVVPNNTSVAVSANTAHSINEDAKTGYTFVSITGNAKCPGVLGGTATLDEGEAITCTITNDDTAPLVENFGSGACLADIPGWDEDAGESCGNGTVAAAISTGDDTASPDGGRFGLLSGNNGFICRAVNATGLQNLAINYYWRGDTEAEDNETGSVQYFTTGTCAAPGLLTLLASHELDDGNNNASEAWSSLQSINLPGSLSNTTFFVRFSADSNGGNESFRLDGVTITGTAI